MRSVLAVLFRFIFGFGFMKPHFFGVYTRLIKPYNLFDKVVRTRRIEGIEYVLDLSDWIQLNLYVLGSYETDDLRLMAQYLKTDSVFLDIGANIGLFSLNASKIIKTGEILAFEPMSKNFNKLTEHIKINNIKSIKAFKKAVSDRHSLLTIYTDANDKNNGMASVYGDTNAGHERVEAVCLDDFLRTQNISRLDFIKIDIEGYELPALNGLKNTIRQHQPVILIEIDANILKQTPFKQEDIVTFFNELGYKAKQIDHSSSNYLMTPAGF